MKEQILLSTFLFDVWNWVYRLGGPGLILLGIVDNSVVPIPGGMDVFVIVLATHHREWWLYYAALATVGAVLGGYLTYRLALKGGEKTVEKKIGAHNAKKVYAKFEKRGFATVLVSAVLPPPLPTVPVLMAAGALKYPSRKFLAALGIGRAVRFCLLALLARSYGTSAISMLRSYHKPVLYAVAGLAAVGAIVALIYLKWYKPQQRD